MSILRTKRFNKAIARIKLSKLDIEDLRDELMEWRENIPYNLVDSLKVNYVQSVIEELESCVILLDEIIAAEITFPRIYQKGKKR